jgi:para-nitrobenzyl esterase
MILAVDHDTASGEPRLKTIKVRQGFIQGEEAGGVMCFKGVPFAAAPVGALRFKPAQPPAPWPGVRPANSFAGAPMQSEPVGAAHLHAPMDEDCLYLNIWAPAEPGAYPIYLWIHGGGNARGAASQALYDGEAFARQGIVCVTTNYRLGVFGFMEAATLLGDDYRGSGVNALLDLVAALDWVRDNAASFQGDITRLTLGGESAGGKNVASLLASPLTAGKVQSAIIQSGGQTVHDAHAADAFASLFAGVLRQQGHDPANLLDLPAAVLISAQEQASALYDQPFPFRAMVGNSVLAQEPIQAFRDGVAKNVRLLIGTNADESRFYVGPKEARQPMLQKDLANVPLAHAQQRETPYAQLYPQLDSLQLRVKLLTAEEYLWPSWQLALAQVRAGQADTWFYRFDYRPRAGFFAGWAAHATELPYVWKTLESPVALAFSGSPDSVMRQLSEQMHGRWCAFIKGGAPDQEGAAQWPPVDEAGACMIFDPLSQPGQLDLVELALWGR